MQDGDPWINGQIMHGINARETIELVASEIEWGTVDRTPAPHLRHGKGIATMIKETATPTSSNVVIKVEQDGKVVVLCAAPEIGAGQATVLSQMAADAIGVPLGAVSIPATDTATTPFNGPVASSRTTYHVGNAIRMAGLEIRRKALALAGKVLGIEPDLLDLNDGVITEQGVGPRTTLRELLGGFGAEGCSLLAEARYSSAESPLLKADAGCEWASSIFWMIASQAVEIEVDIETGVIRVVKVAAAADVGRAINPTACEQQIEGGVVMGLSNALFEEFTMEGGRIENGSLTDYKLGNHPGPAGDRSDHRRFRPPRGPLRGEGDRRAGCGGDGTGDRQCPLRRHRRAHQGSAPYPGQGPGRDRGSQVAGRVLGEEYAPGRPRGRDRSWPKSLCRPTDCDPAVVIIERGAR